ncbi:MAG TPA: EamA family transporter [Pyrinomonadaceae bacterium]|jgi:drug/metabolite transporter (DMT)-like permease|nr:EamA family transporter [Pyrinomonadaceae bacterium]
MDREKLGAYGAWAAVCFFWGTTYLAIAVGLETFQPTLFAGLRFLVAGGVLFFVMSRQRNVRLPVGREWVDLGATGLMLLGVGNGAVVWAEQWVPSGMAALLVATSPFWAAALDRMQKDGERVGLRGLVGMAVGFGGLAMLVGPQLFGGEVNGKYVLGVVIIQVGCFFWQAGSVYAKRRPTGVSPLMASAVQMLWAGAALTLLGTLLGEWGGMRFSARSAGALLYLVVFGSIVAYSAYMYAIQKLPLPLVSTYSYVNPLVALVLGWMVLSERLGWREGVSALVILFGVALVKTSPKELAQLVGRLRRRRVSSTANDAQCAHVTR